MNQIKRLRIGIIGGGQLGRMTCHAAQALGHETVVLSDQADSPAVFASNKSIIANYEDEAALQEFAENIDIATFEFENIPVAGVEFLGQIKPVYPSAKVLKITQNRLLEKSFLNQIGVATADFAAINSSQDLLLGLQEFQKVVLKTAVMGYDGKGQKVLATNEDALLAIEEFAIETDSPNKIPLILEKFCPFASEISVIVARSLSGEITCFKPLTNIHKNGILDKSIYPAKIQPQTAIAAQEIATKIARKLDLQGVLAVEFFVMEGEKLLVNELAPRPHNSGHFSMNAACTSQFEQLIRAITDLPLGNPDFHSRGFMKNLIGDEVENIGDFVKNKNAKIHLYGKKQVKAGRKMGHVNVLED